MNEYYDSFNANIEHQCMAIKIYLKYMNVDVHRNDIIAAADALNELASTIIVDLGY